MNLASYIFEKSGKLGDKTAIFHKDKQMTYDELLGLIHRIIGKLDSLGLERQEKIVIVADNSFFFVAAYFAIIGAGHVAVPLHHLFGEENFKYVFESCKVRCCFIQKKYIGKIRGYGFEPEFLFVDADGIEGGTNVFTLDNPPGDFKEVDEKEDLAVIIFTSGSTGVPKGVMQTHYNIQYNSNSIIEYLELTENDRMMVVLPFSYCFGTSLLHTHLRVGGSVVLNNQFMFPGKVLKEINEKKCTGFAGVPSTYQILLRRSALPKMKFPTLRLVQQAGGKLTPAFIKELREALPNTKIFIMYGQTEATARLSYLPPELLDEKMGSIGKGIPGVTLEVINKETGERVKPGEIGEIVASGGNIMKGYWNDPEGTAKVLRNGKLYTGDLGTYDEDGFIYLTDREKDIIKSGGFRVSPKEVERYISQLKEVVEVAIIPIPDDILGEALKAFVSLTPNATIGEEDIISYCKEHFPSHKVPKEVEILDSLPKNTSNKISKPALKELERKRREQGKC